MKFRNPMIRCSLMDAGHPHSYQAGCWRAAALLLCIITIIILFREDVLYWTLLTSPHTSDSYWLLDWTCIHSPLDNEFGQILFGMV